MVEVRLIVKFNSEFKSETSNRYPRLLASKPSAPHPICFRNYFQGALHVNSLRAGRSFRDLPRLSPVGPTRRSMSSPMSPSQATCWPSSPMPAGSPPTRCRRLPARPTSPKPASFCPRDPAIEREHGVQVRIFTTQEELRFAGHPTLGTASWLYWNHPVLRGAECITLDLPVGPIPVRFGPQIPHQTRRLRHHAAERSCLWNHPRARIGRRRPRSHRRRPRSRASHSDRLHRHGLLHRPAAFDGGGSPADHSPEHRPGLSPCQRRQILPLHHPPPLPSPAPTGMPACSSTTAKIPPPDPPPAAPSPISSATAWRRVKSPVLLEQGIEIQRPSRIYVQATREDFGPKQEPHVTKVFVGGRTIPVAMGRFFLP